MATTKSMEISRVSLLTLLVGLVAVPILMLLVLARGPANVEPRPLAAPPVGQANGQGPSGNSKPQLASTPPSPTTGPTATSNVPPTRGPTPQAASPHLSNGGSPVFVATTDAAWDALFKALGKRDEIGVAELVLSGRVFLVDDGTKVLVLDRGFSSIEIRVVEGSSFGKKGWVPRELVKE